MSSPKIDHSKTICVKCGRKETCINPQGNAIWFSDMDKKGRHTGKYVCYNCHRGIYKLGNKIDMSNRKCCMCGKGDTFVGNDGYAHWLKEYNERNIFTGRYICVRCDSEKRNNNENSYNNLIKLMTMSRMENLSIEDNKGKGLIGEAVIAKVLGLKILGIEAGNLHFEFDLSIDKQYNMIESKIRRPLYGDWKVHLSEYHNFDTLFILCMDNAMKNIVRVYAIPKDELDGLTGITLLRNPTPSIGSKWEKFIIDEKPYNDAYQDLIQFIKDNKFGIEKIKRWMER